MRMLRDMLEGVSRLSYSFAARALDVCIVPCRKSGYTSHRKAQS
jgi:hypothetical protein